MVSRRVNLSEQIQQELQERILTNQYKINEYLPSEAALCEELGVSRTTVRDAISVKMFLDGIKNGMDLDSFQF